jgi:hypothetical protein
VRVGTSSKAAVRRQSGADPQPGDLLLHPLSLGALGLLLLNDHALKSAWPGPISGKLSDVAGMVFFPTFLVSAWEIILAIGKRWRGPSIQALGFATVSAATIFTLVKTVPSAAQSAGDTLGLAQWVLALPVGLIAGRPWPVPVSTRIIADPTDLIAVPMIGLVLWLGIRRARMAPTLVPGARSSG